MLIESVFVVSRGSNHCQSRIYQLWFCYHNDHVERGCASGFEYTHLVREVGPCCCDLQSRARPSSSLRGGYAVTAYKSPLDALRSVARVVSTECASMRFG